MEKIPAHLQNRRNFAQKTTKKHESSALLLTMEFVRAQLELAAARNFDVFVTENDISVAENAISFVKNALRIAKIRFAK